MLVYPVGSVLMHHVGSVLVYPVGLFLLYPAGSALNSHPHPTRPDPTTPAVPIPCPLQGSGGRSSLLGKGGEEEGKRLHRGRNGGFSRCLLLLAAHHSLPPEGIYRVLSVSPSRGRRICAAGLACNLCCSPRWEKPELTREQPAEVRHLPSKPRADKTLPQC